MEKNAKVNWIYNVKLNKKYLVTEISVHPYYENYYLC